MQKMNPEDLIDKNNWKEIDLSVYRNVIKENPGKWVEKIEYMVHGSIYGGYLEDRSIFFDERHNPIANIHLGVDLWQPEGTIVRFPYRAAVFHIHKKNSDYGGWGEAIHLYCPIKGVFIIGHLQDSPLKVYQQINQNDVIGIIGSRENNGGWRPHIHIQQMTLNEYESFKDKDTIDAYLPYNENLSKRYLNPFKEKALSEIKSLSDIKPNKRLPWDDRGWQPD